MTDTKPDAHGNAARISAGQSPTRRSTRCGLHWRDTSGGRNGPAPEDYSSAAEGAAEVHLGMFFALPPGPRAGALRSELATAGCGVHATFPRRSSKIVIAAAHSSAVRWQRAKYPCPHD